MTIDTFTSLLIEFATERDAVAVPGLGTFVMKSQPAGISDNGFTINPPCRRLEFICDEGRQDDKESDFSLLCSKKTGKTVEEISSETDGIVKQINRALDREGVVVLPEFGKLRRLSDGSRFFIMDKDARIDSEYFGLESVSLKNRPEVRLSPAEEKHPEDKVQEKAQDVKNTEKKKKPVVLKIALWLFFLAALLVIGFYVLMNCFPDVLDSLLYSPQELEIIRGNGI